jgi:hypothetical protein
VTALSSSLILTDLDCRLRKRNIDRNNDTDNNVIVGDKIKGIHNEATKKDNPEM